MSKSDDDAFLRALGRRLRATRLRRGLTQAQVCAFARKSPRFLIYLEHGKRNPTILVLRDLAKALKIPAARLIP